MVSDFCVSWMMQKILTSPPKTGVKEALPVTIVQFVLEMGKYTFIITEKPDAAQRIAAALDLKEKAVRMEDRRVPYYVARRDKEIVVVPALGHLYTVAGRRSRRDYFPVFSFKWVPRYVAEKGKNRIRSWLEVITKLAKNADTFVDACDYDIEGSIIGYSILKYACKNKEKSAKRMKYSTLTESELQKSYENLLPHLDFALVEAGRTRHEVDWLYGINLTRALTMTAKQWSGQYATLSTGRVQGPTLKFLAAREEIIGTFVPTPYWGIRAQVEISGQISDAEYAHGKIKTKKDADTIVDECKGRDGLVERVDKKRFQQPSPLPFDLGSLQNEAYRLFGYIPRRTSNVAQRLYLDALISYPRTSSQKLPTAIDYKAILKNLSRLQQYSKLSMELLAKSELKPHEGEKEDLAHPAVYPTGAIPEKNLTEDERNIWNLLVRRFMAVFGEPSIRQSTKCHISINGHCFHLTDVQILREGWLRFYAPYAMLKEDTLPPIEEGQKITIRKIICEDDFTKPPPRYNPSSILKKMEEQEIGTKATRADVIQTLYDRKYVRGEKMVVTDLGFEVLDVLEKYCPSVVSIKLTRTLEERMNRIRMDGKQRESVLMDAVETLKPVTEKLKENEKSVGEQLGNAIRQARFEERIIGKCPACHTGKLLIIHSKKTGKRFVGCTNYFRGLCKASFPLPQRGTVKALGGKCHGCGWPTVHVWVKRKRPWTLCLNPRCPLREKRRIKVEM